MGDLIAFIVTNAFIFGLILLVYHVAMFITNLVY